MTMSRHLHTVLQSAFVAVVLAGLIQAPTVPAQPAAQSPQPTFETAKVEGTEDVYIFRYQTR
jgi:hypothetical protein